MLDGLSKADLRDQVNLLTRQKARMARTQADALRIVFQLPGVVKNYFGADTLSEGTVSIDGQSMQYEIGSIAGLVVSPWETRITLTDLRGERPPRVVALNNGGGAYFSQDATLAMLGYFELLKRTGAGENPDAWTAELNTVAQGADA